MLSQRKLIELEFKVQTLQLHFGQELPLNSSVSSFCVFLFCGIDIKLLKYLFLLSKIVLVYRFLTYIGFKC